MEATHIFNNNLLSNIFAKDASYFTLNTEIVKHLSGTLLEANRATLCYRQFFIQNMQILNNMPFHSLLANNEIFPIGKYTLFPMLCSFKGIKSFITEKYPDYSSREYFLLDKYHKFPRHVYIKMADSIPVNPKYDINTISLYIRKKSHLQYKMDINFINDEILTLIAKKYSLIGHPFVSILRSIETDHALYIEHIITSAGGI